MLMIELSSRGVTQFASKIAASQSQTGTGSAPGGFPAALQPGQGNAPPGGTVRTSLRICVIRSIQVTLLIHAQISLIQHLLERLLVHLAPM